MYRSHQHTALSSRLHLHYSYCFTTRARRMRWPKPTELSILKRRGDSFHGCNILPPFEWIYYIDTQKYFYNALT